VAAEANAFQDVGEFHPIYSLQGDRALATLDQLGTPDVDAVLMLGTGMVTLEAIAKRPRVGRAPVLSCMLATAWRCVAALDQARQDRDSVLAWIDRPAWRGRLDAFLAVRDAMRGTKQA
jgi:maleate isomerase